MQKQARFYLIAETALQSELVAQEALACELAAQAWRLGKRVLIACATEQQALNLDEALWQRDPEQFVPHNLSGEVTQYATPIEISWPGRRNAQRRDLLINLQQQLPDFIASFTQVIDFVPADEEGKAQARERYKLYRQLGFEMITEKA
ncbi:DNA polymerase III chi subunit [Mesocricetibacter intestinalis]|uniref:DNA polymerase III chi subunit n=1 Tax=Mesocricetibacter intestinalis TaxID=1521930 RepID=A0A4R6V8B1_9PAST|nr:DNA polymerase III subunit chi [Mesocricetibacter intestinalis]TDQ57932.1 DNA polymerase III chi subunit [Mesocricetibacter intestinalis]